MSCRKFGQKGNPIIQENIEKVRQSQNLILFRPEIRLLLSAVLGFLNFEFNGRLERQENFW